MKFYFVPHQRKTSAIRLSDDSRSICHQPVSFINWLSDFPWEIQKDTFINTCVELQEEGPQRIPRTLLWGAATSLNYNYNLCFMNDEQLLSM